MQLRCALVEKRTERVDAVDADRLIRALPGAIEQVTHGRTVELLGTAAPFVLFVARASRWPVLSAAARERYVNRVAAAMALILGICLATDQMEIGAWILSGLAFSVILVTLLAG